MKWLILLTLLIGKMVRQPSPIVRVSNGLVRGRISADESFYEFLSIPYATTTPETRFQAPLSEPTWSGVFDAIDEHVRCPQRISDTIVIGQEDCLTLNVYTPVNPSPNDPLPVMVYIHGGGFFDGSGLPIVYGPEYLIRHDVVLVTINYRLNIQGFLCLKIKEAPGNAGLKDQVAALRWIQRNIAAFNGDPDNVTLFGESAGAASVSYHVLSPMSSGLFKRGILLSGSSIAPWAEQQDPMKMANLLAKQLGHDFKDPYELYKLFMNKSYEELIVTRVPRPEGNVLVTELLYVPCVEETISGVESFITESPYNILTQGNYNKVPLIVGYNSNEGYYFAGMETDTVLTNIDIYKALPVNLEFPSEDEKLSVAKQIKDYYFGSKSIGKKTLFELSEFEGDPFLKFPSIFESELILRTTNKPIYIYEFKYSGYLNIVKILAGFGRAPGASHADDIFYFFKPRIMRFPQTIFEMDMINKLTTMWTNFVKYGTPTPEPSTLLPTVWHRTNTTDPQVFVIDEQFSTKPLWADRAMIMWRDIYTKYRSKHS